MVPAVVPSERSDQGYVQASADKQKTAEVGAELFIGNLDALVDEKTLYDTFSRFGSLISPPKIARSDEGLSKGYGFVSYSNFEASDDAINNMNGQYLMNKDVSVQYAYKKDGKGERHGDEAERMLAAQAKKHNVVPEGGQMPPQLLMGANTPQAPPSMMDPSMLGAPAGFAPPRGPMHNNYQSVAPPHAQASRSQPLPPPPSGLPQRPPPSQAGYGGPQDFHPPGFAPPAGPAGFAPPGQMPPGFGPPPGGPPGMGMAAPPGMPPGMAPPGFGMPPGFAPGQGVPGGAPGYGRR